MIESPNPHSGHQESAIIAIDPGLKGAIAISRQDKTTTTRPLPVAGKELHLTTLAEWNPLRQHGDVVYVYRKFFFLSQKY